MVSVEAQARLLVSKVVAIERALEIQAKQKVFVSCSKRVHLEGNRVSLLILVQDCSIVFVDRSKVPN